MDLSLLLVMYLYTHQILTKFERNWNKDLIERIYYQ